MHGYRNFNENLTHPSFGFDHEEMANHQTDKSKPAGVSVIFCYKRGSMLPIFFCKVIWAMVKHHPSYTGISQGHAPSRKFPRTGGM